MTVVLCDGERVHCDWFDQAGVLHHGMFLQPQLKIEDSCESKTS